MRTRVRAGAVAAASFFILFLLIAGTSRVSHAAGCVQTDLEQRVKRFLFWKRAMSSPERAQVVLERPLTRTENARLLEALGVTPAQDAMKMPPKDFLTPEELSRQNRLLLEAGYSEKEIHQLRVDRILPNEVLEPTAAIPDSVSLRTLKFENLDNGSLMEMREGGRFHYVVSGKFDSHGIRQISEIRLVRERPHFTADSLWFTEDAATREKSLVRESGTLRYDPKAKRFIFEPEYGIDLSHSETDEILARAEKDHGIRASRVANPDLAESRVLNCMDVLLNQASGSSLAIDKLVGDFAVTSIVVTTDQLAGGARLSTKEGRRVFLADLLGGAVTNLIGSSVGKSLVVSNSGLAASLATRAGVGFGLTQVQNKITEAFVGGQSETPKNIARFNDVHFAARVPINHFVDTELIQKVPWMGFDACRKGSLAKIFISPRAIRIYERGISAIIYYSARKATIHQ